MRFLCKHCSELIKATANEYGKEMLCPDCQSALTVPTKQTERGALIDDYLMLEPLGEGGFATVYRAHQLSLDRDVALKVVTKDRIDDVMEFVNEARNAAKLTHPNIVQAYAVGNDGPYYFIAMEIVEGDNVGEMLIGHKTMKPATALRIIKDVAAALHYSWSTLHILHRDIKPNNIMIRDKDGLVKLADFGLALRPNEIDHDSETVPGTVEFICPEALTGDPVDIRGDIYSLGASLFRMLTGQLPHPGKDAMEIAKLHVRAPTPDPRAVEPAIPEHVAQICMKMMAKDPEDRYLDAQGLILELEEALRSPMRTSVALIAKEEPAAEAAPEPPPAVAGIPDAATLKMGLRSLKSEEPALPTAEPAAEAATLPSTQGGAESVVLGDAKEDPPTIAPPSASSGLRLKKDTTAPDEAEAPTLPAPAAVPPPESAAPPTPAAAPSEVKKRPPKAVPQPDEVAIEPESSSGGIGKLLAIVIVIALLAGGGWWFMHNQGGAGSGIDPTTGSVESERPAVGGWTPHGDCDLSVVNSMLQAVSTGPKAAIMAELDLDAGAYVVELDVRSSQAGNLRVAWLSSEREKFASSHMKSESVTADDKFQTLRYLMEDTAPITSLGILPVEGGTLAIRAIRVRAPDGMIAKQWGGTTTSPKNAPTATIDPDAAYHLNTDTLPDFSVTMNGRDTTQSSGKLPNGWDASAGSGSTVTVALENSAIRIATDSGKPGASFYRNRIVPLTKGKTYEIRFRYRIDGAARADFTYSGTRLPEQVRPLVSTSEWKEFSTTFTPNQDSSLGVRFRNLSPTPLYLQDFRLLER
jgi:serine/threonine protein kinase